MYYLIYDGNKPVAVSSLTSREGIGYISNVGSLREVRGKGFGKLATFVCIHESMERKNQYHCLATEEGTFAHDFYTRLGFECLLTGVCFVRELR